MKTVAKIRGGLLASVLAGIASMTGASSAHAAIGALDHVPAATLLLPYFEVDEADPNGPQTRFTLANSSDTQTVAHVTLWTDMGVPTLAFDVFLGGRDAADVDLRLLFTTGVLPQTSTAFAHGADSLPHTSVGTCSAGALYAGFPIPDQLPAATISHLQAAHTGHASAAFGNKCSAANHGDSVARGYITIDATSQCSSAFPTDPGYFIDGGNGVATDNNVLFGTYTTIERGNNVTAASPLVAIEASPTLTGSGTSTYYASYVGVTAQDNREPLPTAVWNARTLNVGFFDPGTEIVVWEEPGFPHTPFTCNTSRPDFPRQQSLIVAFDEQEHPVTLNEVYTYPNPPPPPIYPFPLLAQRTSASVMSPFASGSVYINMNNVFPGMLVPGQVQTYVGVRQRFNGVFGAELPATQVTDMNSNPGGGPGH